MKLPSTKTMALALALAGSAFVATTAKAALTYNDGDILLDFRNSGGTNAATNYEIDLGAADTAAFQTGTVDLSTFLSTAELNEITSLYGSGGGTTTWSISGGNSGTLPEDQYSTGDTFFVTQATSATAPVLASNVAPTGQTTESTLGTAFQTSTVTTEVGTTNSGTIAASNGSSYSTLLTQTAGQYFNVPVANPETAYVANGGATLTLYAIQPDSNVDGNNATDYKLANFTFAAPASVPEPSTYVMMFGGLLALVAWKRRNAIRSL